MQGIPCHESWCCLDSCPLLPCLESMAQQDFLKSTPPQDWLEFTLPRDCLKSTPPRDCLKSTLPGDYLESTLCLVLGPECVKLHLSCFQQIHSGPFLRLSCYMGWACCWGNFWRDWTCGRGCCGCGWTYCLGCCRLACCLPCLLLWTLCQGWLADLSWLYKHLFCLLNLQSGQLVHTSLSSSKCSSPFHISIWLAKPALLTSSILHVVHI